MQKLQFRHTKIITQSVIFYLPEKNLIRL